MTRGTVGHVMTRDVVTVRPQQYEFDDTRVSPGAEEYWRQRIG